MNNNISDSKIIKNKINKMNSNKIMKYPKNNFNNKNNTNNTKTFMKIVKIRKTNSPKSFFLKNGMLKKCPKYYQYLNNSLNNLSNNAIKIKSIETISNTSKHKDNKNITRIFGSSNKNKHKNKIIKISFTNNNNYLNQLENKFFQKNKNGFKNWIHKSQEVLNSPFSFDDIFFRFYDKLRCNTINESNLKENKKFFDYNRIYKTPKYSHNGNKKDNDKHKHNKNLRNKADYNHINNITDEFINKDNSLIKSTKDNKKLNKKQFHLKKKVVKA